MTDFHPEALLHSFHRLGRVYSYSSAIACRMDSSAQRFPSRVMLSCQSIADPNIAKPPFAQAPVSELESGLVR